MCDFNAERAVAHDDIKASVDGNDNKTAACNTFEKLDNVAKQQQRV